MKKGISLIVLIVTIIIIIILSGTIILTISNTNIIQNANDAKLKNDLSNIKQEFELYKMTKYTENSEFIPSSLHADKNKASANIKIAASNIYDILPSIKGSNYKEKIQIKEGDLVYEYNNSISNEQKIAHEMGYKIDLNYVKDANLMVLLDGENQNKVNNGRTVIYDRVKKIEIGENNGVLGIDNNTAIYFDEASFLSVDPTKIDLTGDFSLELEVEPEAQVIVELKTLFCQVNTNHISGINSAKGYYLSIGANGQIVLNCREMDGASNISLTSSNNVVEWGKKFKVTLKRQNNIISILVDNIQVATTSSLNEVTREKINRTINESLNYKIYIGALSNTNKVNVEHSLNKLFKGKIHSFKIYKESILCTDLDMSKFLILNSTWKNLANNGKDAILRGFDYTSESGFTNYGMKLDGINDQIDLGEHYYENFTIEAVLELKKQYVPILCNYESGGYGLTLTLKDIFSQVFNSELNTYERSLIKNDFIQEQSKYHVAMTYNNTTKEQKLYINGKLEMSTILNGNIKYPIEKTSLLFGANPRGGTGAGYNVNVSRISSLENLYQGIVNSIRVYNRDLTDKEISQNYDVDRLKYKFNI